MNLWTNEEDGRISCEQHVGGYATLEMQQHPRRTRHHTPLGTWRKMSAEDIAEFEAELADLGVTAECKTCRYAS